MLYNAMKTGVPLFSGVIISLKTFKKISLHLNRAKKTTFVIKTDAHA